MEYGVLVYDVPVSQRSTYNKLRKKIRGIGLSMTWSVYLIPWGARETIRTILKEIEDGGKAGGIDSSVIKFDDSEEKVLTEKAAKSLNQIIRRTKEQVIKTLEKAEKQQTEAVKKYDELIAKKQKGGKVDATIDDLTKYKGVEIDLYENAVKKALNKAEGALKEARKLAVLFNMTNNMEAAFLALDGFVQQKWALVDVKDKTDAMAETE